jgi:hypothetical protein
MERSDDSPDVTDVFLYCLNELYKQLEIDEKKEKKKDIQPKEPDPITSRFRKELLQPYYEKYPLLIPYDRDDQPFHNGVLLWTVKRELYTLDLELYLNGDLTTIAIIQTVSHYSEQFKKEKITLLTLDEYFYYINKTIQEFQNGFVKDIPVCTMFKKPQRYLKKEFRI